MKTKFEQRREYVNSRFGDAIRGKSLSNPQKRVLLKRLWAEAKREYK